MEVWKIIKGYEDYEVSNLGNVKSLKLGKEKILKQSQTGKDYKKNKGYFAVRTVYGLLKVHRLVALAFLENNNNLPQVNHIDKNKHNNNLENLEWCTNIQNSHHSHKDNNFIGVRFRSDRKNYSAEIKYKNVRYRKSGFNTKEEANDFLQSIKTKLCL